MGAPTPTSSPEYAGDILSYLQTHVYEKVTMESLSQRFNLSPAHLSRVFLKTYHTSPIHYFNYCRVHAACGLLSTQRMPIPQIAKKLCYHDTSHFVRTFRHFVGCRPEEYPVT